jgi:hypothetical protein
MRVPPGLIPGVVGVTPMRVPPGLIPGVVGVTTGLVPGPPGPNPGEVGELEEEVGELEEEGWGELLSPPPHPVIVIEAHKIHRQARRVDNHLSITAFGLDKCAYLNDEGM